MQRIIGIDFGTSTTYMNVKRYNGDKPVEDKFSYMPVMFNYGESSGFVASIARENVDGSFDFGEKASEQLDDARVHTEFKMRLESPNAEERSEARRITRKFFDFLYESYAQQAENLGDSGDTVETVVSYPVKWQAETAEFMLNCAREAGFQNVTGVDEATAAVSAVMCRSLGESDGGNLLYADRPGYLMLVDMGAGTTDLVVCKYMIHVTGEVDIEMVTNWPKSAEEPTFGGREVDAALEDYVTAYLAESLNPTLAPQARVIATMRGQAKRWKELNVSANLSANKRVTTCAYIGTYKTMGMLSGDFPAFGREGFERIIQKGIEDYARLIRGCLDSAAMEDAGFAAAGLDLVILTGGHSAWYFAHELVDGTMPGLEHASLAQVRSDKRRTINLSNPQTTVSLGLVYRRLLPTLNIKSVNEDGTDWVNDLPDDGWLEHLPDENKSDVSLAQKAYELINAKANSNIAMQGISGILGFPFTLLADGAVIFTHYGPMLNRIRSLYGRTPVSEIVVSSILKGISNELLFDVVVDKALGNVPLLGIYFNIICAKTMTWRLGTLFTLLSSRGEAINADSVQQAMRLIRKVFPQTDAFTFRQPTFETFVKLADSVAGNSMDEFDRKIKTALSAFDD